MEKFDVNATENYVITINNEVYSIPRQWARDNHPGGELPFVDQDGRDATVPFINNHCLTPGSKVEKFLNTFRVKKDPSTSKTTQENMQTLESGLRSPGDLDIVEDKERKITSYKQIDREFQFMMRKAYADKRWAKTNHWYYILKVGVYQSLLMISGCLAFASQGTEGFTKFYYVLQAAFFLGSYFQQIQFIGHDLGHNQVMVQEKDEDELRENNSKKTAEKKLTKTQLDLVPSESQLLKNKILGCLFGNLFSGIGIGWWTATHNTHHLVTNSVNFDCDVQHLPQLQVSPKCFDQFYSFYHHRVFDFGRDKIQHFLVKYQEIGIFPVLFGFGRFNLYLQTLMYNLTNLFLGIKRLIMGRKCIRASHPAGVPILKQTLFEIQLQILFFWWLTQLVSVVEGGWYRAFYLCFQHSVAGFMHLQILLSHYQMPLIDGNPLPPMSLTETDDTASTTASTSSNQSDSESENENSEKDIDILVSRNSKMKTDKAEWFKQSYVLSQLYTCLDVECPRYMDWLHGGLQFQTTHHL